MEPFLAYPARPFAINQLFGANPEYYAKFLDRFGNPQHGHMGLDLRAPHGTPLRAPVSGLARYEKDGHGGEGIYIRVTKKYKGVDRTFNIILWHIIGDTDSKYPSPFPLDGEEHWVNRGDLIAYADNTGAPYESIGPHCHFGLIPFDETGAPIEGHNGFNGCIDPLPYFDGTYADTPIVQHTTPIPQPVYVPTQQPSDATVLALWITLRSIATQLRDYLLSIKK